MATPTFEEYKQLRNQGYSKEQIVNEEYKTPNIPPAPKKPSFVQSVGKNIGNVLYNIGSYENKVWNDYKTAGQNIVKSITQGAEQISQGEREFNALKGQNKFAPSTIGKGLKAGLHTLRGVAQAGLGTAGNVAGAVFAPITEGVKSIIPGEGPVSQVAEGATTGAAFGGPVGAGIGALISAGMLGVNAVRGTIVSQPKIAKFLSENPDVEQDINNAINIAMLALATKGSEKLSPEGKTDILNTPIQEVPGRVGENLMATGQFVLKPGVVAFNWAKKGLIGGKQKLQEKIVGIDKTVQTVLDETDQKTFDSYAKQAQAAKLDVRNKTPLEMAGKRAEDALEAIREKKNIAGEQKSQVLSEIGNKKVNASVVSETIDDINTGVRNQFGVQGDKNGQPIPIAGRSIKISDGEIKLIQQVNELLVKAEKNPTIQIIDDVIDRAQDLIYKRQKTLGLEPISPEVDSFLQSQIGQLNSKLKNVAGQKYITANADYQSLNSTYYKLNKMLGESGSKGGSLMKKVFSPTDSGTKKMFSDIKNITGIDLANEAVLAKFTMEVIGDSRQTNILNELATTGLKETGLTGWFAEKAITPQLNKIKLETARNMIPKLNNISNARTTPAFLPSTGATMGAIQSIENKKIK